MISLWWFPTLISAMLLGCYDVCIKNSVRENAVLPVLFFANLSGALFFIAATALAGTFSAAFFTDLPQFLFILLKSVIVAASWICCYFGLREMPLSLAAPIRSTSPLWTLLGGVLLFREIPTAVQAAGMAVILAGYFLFSVIGKSEGFSWKSRSMVLMISGTFFGAVSALYDKYLLNVRALPREMTQMHFAIGVSVIFGIMAFVSMICRRGKKENVPFRWRWTVPMTGILLIISDFCYFFALSQVDAPISMISLLRRCNCIVAFLLGVWIFCDRQHFRRKCAALVVLMAGAALLALK